MSRGPRPGGHYLTLVSGKWRDVVLAYTCDLIAHGAGASLKRCEVCDRAFAARRSTATLCPRQECKRERNSHAWKKWVTGCVRQVVQFQIHGGGCDQLGP